jgi:hypothetical protein
VQTANQFFTEQCDWFAQNKLGLITSGFAVPMAVYFGEQIMIFKNIKAIQTALSTKRTALLNANYSRTGFRIIAESISAKKHLSLWVEFRHFDVDNHLITSSTSRYFCARQTGPHLLVQLIEYLQIPNLDAIKEHDTESATADYQSTVAPV